MTFRPAWPGQVASLGYVLVHQIEADLGLRLTDEQTLRCIEYYRLDPKTGRRLVRRAALRRPKGAGKSPEGGYIGYAEFCLPTQFAYWDVNGQPVGTAHPDPWIQFAAVSEDQTDNVMVWLYDVLSGPAAEAAIERHRIDLGKTRVYFKGRPGRIEPVTAAAPSREGQRVTFGVLDQSESWSKANGGVKLADTLRRNAAKMNGWTLELQNAPMIGDGSVADLTAKAAQRAAKGVLYDTREPPGADTVDLADSAALMAALVLAYGDAVQWVNLDRLLDEIRDPATDPSDARRFYLNTASPSSDWAFDHPRWDDLGGHGLIPKAGSLIVAGFDGARHEDATALVAVDVVTGTAWTVGAWEKPDNVDAWEVPEVEVSDAVGEMFDRWSVWRLYADPPYWEPTIATWSKHKGSDRRPAVFEWSTNRYQQVGFACRQLATAIRAGQICHEVDDGDDVLTRHMKNAVKRTVASRDDKGIPLWTISKPAESRKIDAAMALVLAWEARTDAITAGVKPRKKAHSVFL